MPAVLPNAHWIDISATDGPADNHYGAYLSLPPAGHGPGLVLFQEIFGVNAHIRAVADQYALDGYVVLAPDVFWRQAPRAEFAYTGADQERAGELSKQADFKLIAADIKTTVAALRARPEVVGKIGALGFCLGGRLAYLAASLQQVDAATSYYGGRIQDHLEHVESITCPMQFHYAGHDNMIPPEAVAKVQAAFAGKDASFYLYPEASHGFNCWDRKVYHQPSAVLAHGRTLLHLAQHLG